MYPVGHPTITYNNLTDVDVRQYFRLVKCDVLPPRQLLHPVLPYRCNQKLMFVFCRTCAETEQQSPCCPDDTQRHLRGEFGTQLGEAKDHLLSGGVEVEMFYKMKQPL